MPVHCSNSALKRGNQRTHTNALNKDTHCNSDIGKMNFAGKVKYQARAPAEDRTCADSIE